MSAIDVPETQTIERAGRQSLLVINSSVPRTLLVPALCLLTALVQTAPLALHLTTCVPFGNYPAPTVVRFNLWTLWWNSDRLLHGYGGYWRAPIFYPDSYSFAYSEPQWLTGLIASPLWWLRSANPAFVYNAILLMALTLNGWAGYYLVRRLQVPFWPAVCGGIIMEMIPTVADQLGVLQSTALFPILFTLISLVSFARRGRPSAALGLALGMTACFHTSSNMALFFGPMAPLGLLVLGRRGLIRPWSILSLAVAVLAAGLLIAPVATVQSRVLQKLEPYRLPAEIADTSAHFGTYLHMPPTNLLRRRLPDRKVATLYPGTVMLLLGTLGACAGLSQRGLRPWTIYALLAATFSAVLSFGPLLHAEPLGSLLSAPYELLKDYYPGFRFARNLWRFGVLAQIFVATLAGIGIAACFGVQHRPLRIALGSLATATAFIDLLSAPIPLLDIGPTPTQLQWVRWLRDSPADTTIIHLPMPTDTFAEDFERTTYWMDCQMYHGRPMANGYAAYIPAAPTLLMQLMPRFPDADSIRALQYFGINHVLASSEWSTSEQAKKLDQWKTIVVPELATSEMMIYRIVGAAPEGSALRRGAP